jgi:(1->4)-alpha-D-glucan 1-alpha-D-glucosylmutase
MRWTRRSDRYRSRADAQAAPGRRDQYTLFQALVGAWPCGRDALDGREELVARTARYMEKAVREAKLESSWLRTNEAYEEAVRHYVEASLRDDGFAADVAGFCARLGTYGAANSLALVLLRACAPGIPDTYQGGELWNQSYVDPDNRGEVDFDTRRRRLAELTLRSGRDRLGLARSLLESWSDGRVKMYVLHEALRTRARLVGTFRRGDYEPILAGDHVVSFARAEGDGRVVVVAPRLPFRLTRGEQPWPIGEAWGEQRLPLPAGCYRDAFTGAVHDLGDEPVRLADLLSDFPVALLVDDRARS